MSSLFSFFGLLHISNPYLDFLIIFEQINKPWGISFSEVILKGAAVSELDNLDKLINCQF